MRGGNYEQQRRRNLRHPLDTYGRNSWRWWTDSQFLGSFDYEDGLLILNVKHRDNAPETMISTL